MYYFHFLVEPLSYDTIFINFNSFDVYTKTFKSLMLVIGKYQIEFSIMLWRIDEIGHENSQPGDKPTMCIHL